MQRREQGNLEPEHKQTQEGLKERLLHCQDHRQWWQQPDSSWAQASQTEWPVTNVFALGGGIM